MVLSLLLTSCGDRRAYEELSRALGPPVQLLCSIQRKDVDAVGCSKTCAAWRAAEDARVLSRAAGALAQVPPFKGGEETKRLVTMMREQAVVLETAFQICGPPPKVDRTGEPPAEERACADQRVQARTLKAEAELEDLLTKIAHAPDRPSDVAFPDPAKCAR